MAEPKVWRFLEPPSATVEALSSELGLSRLAAVLLANRGCRTSREAEAFRRREPPEFSDPFALPDMDRAVTRILRALAGGESICVYGDYDVDGLTATALLVSVLRELGGRADLVGWHIPGRAEEGYGLSRSALERLAASGTRLVVTVDCGVTAVEEARLARRLGLDLVVTDHHEPGPFLPPAVAVVDPRRRDCRYPFRDLAGVGVAYKLALALAETYTRYGGRAPVTLRGRSLTAPRGRTSTTARGWAADRAVGAGSPAGSARQLSLFEPPPDRWDEALDLVALGTVADVVPLVGENRSLVFRGLRLFNPPRRVGLAALQKAAGLEGRSITAYHLGFRLAPRLNAAGRVGDAERSLRLLLTGDPVEAETLAAELEQANRERQALEESVLAEAVARLEESAELDGERAIVLEGRGWPEGVIGIVAARLVERYGRPALLVAVNDGRVRGSGRSVPAFDLAEALSACAHRLGRHGGHRLAAGFELGEEAIVDFKRDFLELARRRLAEEDLVREVRIDACVAPEELLDAAGQGPSPELFRELELLEPHGQGNPEPVLAMLRVRFASVRTVGEGGRHLRATVLAGKTVFGAVGFGLGRLAGELARDQGLSFDVAFRPAVDDWNGRCRVELRLIDVRPAGKE